MSTSFNIAKDSPIVLRLTLPENDSSKFVRAYVRNQDNVSLAGSPFTLNNLGDGRYFFKDGINLIFPVNDTEINVVYKIFDDAGFTVPTVDYTFQSEDVFRVFSSSATEESMLQATLDTLVTLVNKVLILSPDIEVEIDSDDEALEAEVEDADSIEAEIDE